ncbi:MAG TPA: MBOAT family O-acyltransferase [Acidocella sp.]|nr:MBOAT family O-acyltransferase [Acidocella sp.]
MLFNTKLFILGFLPVTIVGFLVFGRLGRHAALSWILCCSLAFYAWWKPIFVMLLMASILVNFAVGRKINAAKHRRIWLVSGLLFNLGLLGFFKYADFFASLLGASPLFGGIFLPLGISFFTFQQVMYLVDTERGDIQTVPFLDYACFIAFFPHLIAGPIVRPRHILPQLAQLQPCVAWRERLTAGLEIFLLGLAKKLVLADGFAHFANPGFAAAARLDSITLIEAWVALLAYALQIYFDFSGYSDMAIGLARMFGIHFPINFNSPYQARDISDFWRRWNITLSAFLREYLYIPLGGNRRGEVRRIFNLMLTMLLGGLWHGAALRFVFWGGLHGAFLVVHGWSQRLGLRLPAMVSWLVTLFSVVLAWVPFRADGFAAAMDFYRGLFGLNGIAIPAIYIRTLPILGHFGRSVPVLPYLGAARTLSLPQAVLFLALGWLVALALPGLHRMSRPRRSAALVASFALSLQALFFAPYTVPFLYFQF